MRITQLLTLTTEAKVLISTHSRQGWMVVTSFRGSMRRPR